MSNFDLFVVVAMLVISAIWLRAVVKLHALDEWHHFYIGLALSVLPYPAVQVLGVYIAADDAWQHTVQLHHPGYLSPLHRLWDWVATHLRSK